MQQDIPDRHLWGILVWMLRLTDDAIERRGNAENRRRSMALH
jgi:hypothetical protein